MKKSQIIGWIFIGAVILAAAVALSGKSPDNLLVKYQWHCETIGHFSLTLNIPDSIFAIYSNKKRPAKQDPNTYYQNFITNDPLVKKLAQKLTNIAKALCSDDPTIFEQTRSRLNIAFWQNMPYSYDDTLDYPTTSLIRGSGSCFDKTIGCLAVFKEWGYGCAMLYFDSIPLPNGGYDQHVTLGLQSDDKKYFGDFTYVELSRSTPIGVVPTAQCAGSLVSVEEQSEKINAINARKLGKPEIYLASQGKKFKF